MSTLCAMSALPGKKFCSFHDTLVGPWALSDKHFKNIR